MSTHMPDRGHWTNVTSVPQATIEGTQPKPWRRRGSRMTEREALFLRHHGLPVTEDALLPTNFNEWMRVVMCLARRNEPHLFDAGGWIRDHDDFTRWLAEAYPPDGAARQP